MVRAAVGSSDFQAENQDGCQEQDKGIYYGDPHKFAFHKRFSKNPNLFRNSVRTTKRKGRREGGVRAGSRFKVNNLPEHQFLLNFYPETQRQKGRRKSEAGGYSKRLFIQDLGFRFYHGSHNCSTIFATDYRKLRSVNSVQYITT